MYAVAGRWSLDPAFEARQSAHLRGIVENVRQRPGFVRGFWSRAIDNRSVNVTYIVFDDRRHAEQFIEAVLSNAPAQSASGVARDELMLVEVEADA